MVYGLCRAMLRDPDEAEDATQSAFVSAFASLSGGARVREEAAWLATIARHECLARIQKRMREPLPLPDADVVLLETPQDEVERSLAVHELREAIATLPVMQRDAVVLRDIYGLRYREVGAALGVSRPSVESLLFRARRTLRRRLRPALGASLIVPLAVREGVAQAVPFFAGPGAAGVGAAASAGAGVGLLAKLGSAPVAAKVAAGVVAVSAGSVAAVEVEHARKQGPQPPPVQVPSSAPRQVGGNGRQGGPSANLERGGGAGGDVSSHGGRESAFSRTGTSRDRDADEEAIGSGTVRSGSGDGDEDGQRGGLSSRSGSSGRGSTGGDTDRQASEPRDESGEHTSKGSVNSGRGEDDLSSRDSSGSASAGGRSSGKGSEGEESPDGDSGSGRRGDSGNGSSGGSSSGSSEERDDSSGSGSSGGDDD